MCRFIEIPAIKWVCFKTYFLEKNITVNVFNPGVCRTEVHRHMPFKQSAMVALAFSPFMWFLMKSAKDGAQGAIYLAVSTEEKESTGKLYV